MPKNDAHAARNAGEEERTEPNDLSWVFEDDEFDTAATTARARPLEEPPLRPDEDTPHSVVAVGNAPPGILSTVLVLILIGLSAGLGWWGYRLASSGFEEGGALAGLGWQDASVLILGKYLLWVVAGVGLALATALSLHYHLLGPKVFAHGQDEVTVFSRVTRINHWLAALSCTVLIVTGIGIMVGGTPGLEAILGGNEVILLARHVHAATTIVFTVSVVVMLLGWLTEMLPRMADLRWLMVTGGYLSRKRQRIPAHMFNAGQKMWFWLITLGGLVMTATGAAMFFIFGSREFLGKVAIAHNALAIAIVAMYMVHVYMAVFAIRGTLGSMLHGKKGRDELYVLHSLYHDELEEHGEL